MQAGTRLWPCTTMSMATTTIFSPQLFLYSLGEVCTYDLLQSMSLAFRQHIFWNIFMPYIISIINICLKAAIFAMTFSGYYIDK